VDGERPLGGLEVERPGLFVPSAIELDVPQPFEACADEMVVLEFA
jgi:hypothetical protein